MKRMCKVWVKIILTMKRKFRQNVKGQNAISRNTAGKITTIVVSSVDRRVDTEIFAKSFLKLIFQKLLIKNLK